MLYFASVLWQTLMSPWGSKSIKRTFLLFLDNPAARLTDVVVLPTPPFWLKTAIFLIKAPLCKNLFSDLEVIFKCYVLYINIEKSILNTLAIFQFYINHRYHSDYKIGNQIKGCIVISSNSCFRN